MNDIHVISSSDFEKVLNMLNCNDYYYYDRPEIEFIIDSCKKNPEYVKKIGTSLLFNLCESLITNGEFADFKDLILKIVSLDPEMFYLGDCTKYNLFMMALDNYYNIDKKDLIDFIESLKKLLYDYRTDRLVNHQELRLLDWNVENAVSTTTIPKGKEDEFDDDRQTVLSLAISTGDMEVVDTCFFMGSHKIMPDDDDEPPEVCILTKNVIEECLENYDFDEVTIDNFGMKMKIFLCLELFKTVGFYGITECLGADLSEYMMEDE
jgi:hypothetical protein